jgi:hypothetical protein
MDSLLRVKALDHFKSNGKPGVTRVLIELEKLALDGAARSQNAAINAAQPAGVRFPRW